MPVLIITAAEVFDAAREQGRDIAEQILKLSDLDASPLQPGETADARRHQIAKLGKALAVIFVRMDNLAGAGAEAEVRAAASQPSDPSPPKPETN